MKIKDFQTESWSQKYKSSINCSHPKGFSQRAHCAGKNKQNESVEMEMVCADCGMCKSHGSLNEIKKGQKDSNGYTRCWPGKHAEGTKKGKNGGQVRNCVPNESVAEGLHPMVIDDVKKLATLDPVDRYSAYANIRGYFKGDPELSKMASDLQGGYYEADMLRSKYKTDAAKAKYAELEPMHQAFIKQAPGQEQGVAEGFNGEYDDEAGMAQGNLYTIAKAAQGLLDTIDDRDNLPEWAQEKIAKVEGMLVTVWNYLQSQKAQGIDPEIAEMYDAMDQLAEEMALKNRVSVDLVWESFEALDDHMLYETAAWRRKEGKSKKGGLNAKGVASYRRENPGSKLQTAVTTKPSKLKPGSKAAKRRKSFCARMSGVKGPAKKPNGKPTRKTLALRKWNC